MAAITIDHQLAQETCPCCGIQFEVSRGCAYQDGEPYGIYLAAMHGCRQRMVLLAVGLQADGDNASKTVCATLKVWCTPAQFEVSFTDPRESPWAREEYLQPLLSRQEALAHPLKSALLAVVDQIVLHNPVHGYLIG
jgi:hypothetical protein